MRRGEVGERAVRTRREPLGARNMAFKGFSRITRHETRPFYRVLRPSGGKKGTLGVSIRVCEEPVREQYRSPGTFGEPEAASLGTTSRREVPTFSRMVSLCFPTAEQLWTLCGQPVAPMLSWLLRTLCYLVYSKGYADFRVPLLRLRHAVRVARLEPPRRRSKLHRVRQYDRQESPLYICCPDDKRIECGSVGGSF